jgi:hypothetical protein
MRSRFQQVICSMAKSHHLQTKSQKVWLRTSLHFTAFVIHASCGSLSVGNEDVLLYRSAKEECDMHFPLWASIFSNVEVGRCKQTLRARYGSWTCTSSSEHRQSILDVILLLDLQYESPHFRCFDACMSGVFRSRCVVRGVAPYLTQGPLLRFL